MSIPATLAAMFFGTTPSVDVAGLKTAMDTGEVVLIDVRTPAEYAEGHVPGAIHLPLDKLLSGASVPAAPADPVYLICRSGGRSGKAVGYLSKNGFAKPINVTGGTLAWQAAGYSVTK